MLPRAAAKYPSGDFVRLGPHLRSCRTACSPARYGIVAFGGHWIDDRLDEVAPDSRGELFDGTIGIKYSNISYMIPIVGWREIK